MFVIGTAGPPYAPRYYIQDEEKRFWSDKLGGWTQNPREAALFSDQGEVGHRVHELFLAQIPGEVQTFVVPVMFEVKAEDNVTVEQLRKWLDRALSFCLDAAHGTGPVPNSMATLCVYLYQLKELKHE